LTELTALIILASYGADSEKVVSSRPDWVVSLTGFGSSGVGQGFFGYGGVVKVTRVLRKFPFQHLARVQGDNPKGEIS
jgi:hypothetical protein